MRVLAQCSACAAGAVHLLCVIACTCTCTCTVIGVCKLSDAPIVREGVYVYVNNVRVREQCLACAG